MSRTPALFLSAAFLAAPLTAQTAAAGAPVPETRVEVRGVEITYLANAGFYLEAGPHAVLIDACLREPFGVYSALPGPVHGKLTNAKPPFDHPMLVLVSHAHEDHVQPRVLDKLLTNNAGARLMTSAQVIQQLEGAALDFAAIRSRVEAVQVVPGSMKTWSEEGLKVSFFPLEHSGKNHAGLVSLGHLIELGGLRILHVGDAEPRPGNFAAYALAAQNIDVAIVPYWYFGSAAGAQVLHEEIAARTVIACHVPPKEWERLSELLKTQFPDVVLFKEALEKRSFLPADAPPAGKDGGAGSGG